MKKLLKVLKWLSITVALVIIVGLVLINVLTYHPQDSMYDHIDAEVNETDDYFVINGESQIATIVYYPGGLVSAESYLLQASYLADENIRVIIPKMPFNLAILDRFVFNDIYNEDEHPWFIAGHSLGGASMAFVADENPKRIDGLIFIAAYPPSSVDLKHSNLDVLSITASNDGVMDFESFDKTKDLLPKDSRFEEIEGGNHAQFGYYGPQRGDKEATISVYAQHQKTTDYIVNFIQEVLNE